MCWSYAVVVPLPLRLILFLVALLFLFFLKSTNIINVHPTDTPVRTDTPVTGAITTATPVTATAPHLDTISPSIPRRVDPISQHRGQCPVCQNDLYVEIGKKTIPHVSGPFSYVRCLSCGFRYVNPVPKVTDLEIAYRTYKNQAAPLPAQERALSQGVHLREALERVHGQSFADHNYSMAEVGCARGYVLQNMSPLLDSMYCLEPNTQIAASGVSDTRNLHVLSLFDVEDFAASKVETFSIWSGSHVSEHMRNPCEQFKAMRKTSAPNAIFFQEIPVYGTDARVAADPASHIHLSYFTLHSFDMCVRRAGWTRLTILGSMHMRNNKAWVEIESSNTDLIHSFNAEAVFLGRFIYVNREHPDTAEHSLAFL